MVPRCGQSYLRNQSGASPRLECAIRKTKPTPQLTGRHLAGSSYGRRGPEAVCTPHRHQGAATVAPGRSRAPGGLWLALGAAGNCVHPLGHLREVGSGQRLVRVAGRASGSVLGDVVHAQVSEVPEGGPHLFLPPRRPQTAPWLRAPGGPAQQPAASSQRGRLGLLTLQQLPQNRVWSWCSGATLLRSASLPGRVWAQPQPPLGGRLAQLRAQSV